MSQGKNKTALARALGVSRSSLYYVSRMDEKDWQTKVRMEEELSRNPGYGSRRLAGALGICRTHAQRVMRKYGIRPYRRRGRKSKTTKAKRLFPNLLLSIIPSFEGHIWATDFTELVWRDRKIYASTIIDLYTRKIVALHVGVRKGAPLTIHTLAGALLHYAPPKIFHSDNGREYEARSFLSVLEQWGIQVSRSRPGCPWENGYQESFYGKFKVDLGDPNRFKTLGELVAAIHHTIWQYNHTRIHSALRMPPAVFANQIKQKTAVLAV